MVSNLHHARRPVHPEHLVARAAPTTNPDADPADPPADPPAGGAGGKTDPTKTPGGASPTKAPPDTTPTKSGNPPPAKGGGSSTNPPAGGSRTSSPPGSSTSPTSTGPLPTNLPTAGVTPPAQAAPPPVAGGGGTQQTPSAPSFFIPSGNSTSGNASGTIPGAASPSPTAAGLKTTTIVGMAAGGLLGVALVIALVAFLIRRCRKRDEMPGDMFDRTDFVRNSVVLQDGPSSAAASLGGGRRGNPRPPTMIERHLAPSRGAPPSMPSQQQYGGYNNYGQQQQDYYGQGPYPGHPFSPQQPFLNGQQYNGFSPAQSPVYQNFDESGNAPYLNNQVASRTGSPSSMARSLTRPPSDGQNPNPFAGQGQQPHHPQQQYNQPYPDQSYARLDRQGSPPVPQGLQPPMRPYMAGPSGPAGMPQMSAQGGPMGQAYGAPHHANGQAAQHHGRPESVYDEEDAYGGI